MKICGISEKRFKNLCKKTKNKMPRFFNNFTIKNEVKEGSIYNDSDILYKDYDIGNGLIAGIKSAGFNILNISSIQAIDKNLVLSVLYFASQERLFRMNFFYKDIKEIRKAKNSLVWYNFCKKVVNWSMANVISILALVVSFIALIISVKLPL